MIKDSFFFFYNSVHPLKCKVHFIRTWAPLKGPFFQGVEWFQSAQKKKKIYQETWRKSVLYLPRTLPLVRACAYCLWLLASVGVLVFMFIRVCACVCVCTVLEYVGLVFVKGCSKRCVANPMVCDVHTLFNVQQINTILLIFVQTFYMWATSHF